MKRGQATVELALLSLVFITILIFGIHFAELGTMKLRVQQAAVFATWQATGDRAHQLDRGSALQSPLFFNANHLKNAGGFTPEQETRARYHDFEALRETGKDHASWAATKGSQLTVRCDPKRVAIPPVKTVAINRLASAYTFPQQGARDVDGVGCSATGRIALFGLPREVLEGSSGFFRLPNAARPVLTVCAIGRADHGVCTGQIPFAIDDWGLQGDSGGESSECNFDCTNFESNGNIAYKQSVERLYREYTGAHDAHWAIDTFVRELFTNDPVDPSIMSVVPVDERDFRFAFIGERAHHPFAITTSEIDGPGGGTGFGPNHRVLHHWATTPYSSRYAQGYSDRGDCFAGLPCDRNPFDKQHWH